MRTSFLKTPQAAFEAAITRGILSSNSSADNYAGHYMYMGTVPIVEGSIHYDKDSFKHIDTRQYVTMTTLA